MADEVITTKHKAHDLNKYKEEIASFIKDKRTSLDINSEMRNTYDTLYRAVFKGTTKSCEERFPHATEMFKIYKTSTIEASLSGYSALVEVSGWDAASTLKAPELKTVMTEQFQKMSLLEKLSGETVDDWLLKGEAVSFVKYIEDVEEYRIKTTMVDMDTGEDVAAFDMKKIASNGRIEIDRIDPLDFFVDALDYEKDPKGCAKIIRSFIDSKTLMTSDNYPLLTKEEKQNIVTKSGKMPKDSSTQYYTGMYSNQSETNASAQNNIEVLTFFGDYITNDYKVLKNIKAVVINGSMANIKYNGVNTNQIIYAAYKVDEDTHRGITPLASVIPVNTLVNRAIDMVLGNVEDTSVPVLLYEKGSINASQVKEFRTKKEIEYSNVSGAGVPQLWTPPPFSPNVLSLMEVILGQNKSVLGLNAYVSGDSGGAVRTAKETAVLSQRQNVRSRIETDVFSYNYMLRLFNAFYSYNRELALVAKHPLAPIYEDPTLQMSISTSASRADKTGELNKLMQMLELPISQMIFSNLTPEQTSMAVRYLMAKAELTDYDNLLELTQSVAPPQPPIQSLVQQLPPEVQSQLPQIAQMIEQQMGKGTL